MNAKDPNGLIEIKHLDGGGYLKSFDKGKGNMTFTYFKGNEEIYKVDYGVSEGQIMIGDIVTIQTIRKHITEPLLDKRREEKRQEIKDILTANGYKCF
jgi:hypothetical protein